MCHTRNGDDLLKHRTSGLTIIELTVALAIFITVGMASLTVMSQAIVSAKEQSGRQQALERAVQKIESMLASSGSNSALHTTWNDPPNVVVEDSDGDEIFNTGLAQIVVREEYPSLNSNRSLIVELVIWRAD